MALEDLSPEGPNIPPLNNVTASAASRQDSNLDVMEGKNMSETELCAWRALAAFRREEMHSKVKCGGGMPCGGTWLGR